MDALINSSTRPEKMGSSSAVSAVMARLEYLVSAAAVVEWTEDIMQIESRLADLNAHGSFISKRHEKDVRQLAYDIEDIIESYVRDREEVVGKPSGCLWKFLPGRSLKDDLSIYRKKINNVRSHISNYSPDKRLGAAELGTEENYNNYSSSSGTISPAVTTGVVGLQDDIVTLASHLTNAENQYLSVVAIYGMGGMGKTTLSRSLFDDPSVKEHFDFRTWVHAGVDFQARGILEYILSDVCSDWSMEKVEEMESMELMAQIYKACKGRRYLVVLDDIWSSDDWETIRFAFPDDNEGSRVIITTRWKSVADDAADYKHKMTPLTDKDSWELMKTRLGPRCLDTKAQEIGQQIIKYCGGVPLAIVLCSNLLGQVKKLEDWKALLQQLEQDQNQKKCENVIDFSYNLLPIHLKPCFLYLGHFPTDHGIPIEKLYQLWMAEGFISAKGVPSLSKFDIAKNYFKALVDRSMVMIRKEEVSATRRPESCHIHDLLRDLCIEKGRDEEFFRVVDSRSEDETSFTSRRLAIYLNKHENVDGVSLKIAETKTVRSLLFFETKQNSKWPTEVADLKEFRSTRVLDFDGVDFRVKQLPKNIKKLVYLRYLSLRGCYLLEFPSSFSNLTFLETLDLLVRESCRITIPNVLRNFKRLRHLYLPVVFQTDSKAKDLKLKLNGLTELEILQNFHSGLCDANDLPMLDNIKSFTGVVDGNNDDLAEIVNRLTRWDQINCSETSLVVKNFDCYSEKRLSIVKDLLTRCNALRVLEIAGHLPRLPIEISTNFTEMVFNGSEFEQDAMQILGKLPKLRRLVLSNNAFAGTEMVCSKSDFPQLTILKLAMLQRLRKWEVNSGAMPNLALLTIEQCKGLQTLPHELMKITTLQELKIGSMPQKFQQNARSIAEMLHVHAKVRVSTY